MTNLLRFDFNDRDGIFEVVENGDWVRAADYDALAAGKEQQMSDNNLDIMTQELVYSDFADLIISKRLKGTIEDCFAYLEGVGDTSKKEMIFVWQLSTYQDNINMIRGCIQVLQWFTTDNYEHELAEVNKYSLSIGEMF
jgi:hypothetical protein